MCLAIFNEGANLANISAEALTPFTFDCESLLESVPGTNQY